MGKGDGEITTSGETAAGDGKYGDGRRISRSAVKYGDVDVFDQNDAQLQQLAEIARVDLNATSDVLAALGAEELSRAEFSVMRAGAYFLQLKRQCGHGGFLPALESAGINPNRAQRAMQIATYVASLPPTQARRLAELPKSKLLALVNADQEVLGELLEQGALEGNEPISVRELIQRVKKAEQRAADAQTREQASEFRASRFAEQAGAVSPSIEKEFAAIRDRATFLTERMAHEVALLGSEVTQKIITEGWRAMRDATDRQAVASVLFHALRGVVANASLLLETIGEAFGSHVTGDVQDYLRYMPAERKHLMNLREAALTTAEKDYRAAEIDSRKKHKTAGRHS